MTGNTDTFKEKTESKLPIQINEGRCINNTLEKKNVNVKKKKESASHQRCKKMNVRQKVKQKSVKQQKDTKKVNVSNMILKHNEEMYECQIQQLNLMLKQSLKYPTLTQDELDILSMKYKVDGHYKINKNLPPFTSLLDDTHNINSDKIHVYGQMRYISNNNIQTKPRKNETMSENQNTENLSSYDISFQPSFKYDMLKNAEVLDENNIDNKLQNKNLYTDQTFLGNNNYNYICMNYDMQTHSNTNILSDIENLPPQKSNSDVKNITDLQEEHFKHSLTNIENIMPEEHEINKNFLYNTHFSSSYHEDLYKNSEICAENSLYNLQEYNDFSMNSNFCNDLNFTKWNNITSTNCQPWKNVQSMYIPQSSNIDSYNIKNSTATNQLMLIKGQSEERGDQDLHNYASTYTLANNANYTHDPSDGTCNFQQNINACNENLNVVSDTFLPETNIFMPYSTVQTINITKLT